MRRAAASLLLLVALTASADVVKRGAPISEKARSVALADVLANPDRYGKEPVVVDGVVSSVCTNMGCWMQLAPEAKAAGIRVTFKDYGFFVPTDSKGMRARAEGVATVRTLSKEEADHLEGDGAGLARQPDGTAREVAFVANGVELRR